VRRTYDTTVPSPPNRIGVAFALSWWRRLDLKTCSCYPAPTHREEPARRERSRPVHSISPAGRLYSDGGFIGYRRRAGLGRSGASVHR